MPTHAPGSRPNCQSGRHPLYVALAGYLLWSFATWLLEGRAETLLRPEATVDRLLYTGIANIVIGQIGALTLLGLIVRCSSASANPVRLTIPKHRTLALAAACMLGIGTYAAAGGGIADSALVVNTFAQVLVVSAAEVIVCWGLIGVATESSLRTHLGAWSPTAAAVAASVAFGLYHLAHSPPFNTLGMVLFLSCIGLVTSLFFFVTRDLLATAAMSLLVVLAGERLALAVRR
jgi:hypothetical protein